MKLLLSSDAMPAASAEALGEAARRRSLAGLELALDVGQGHGADAPACAARQEGEAPCFPETAVPIVWLRVPEASALAMRAVWARAARSLGAGLLLPGPVPEPAAPVPTALVHDTGLDAARQSVRWAEAHGTQTAWRVRPAAFDADLWEAVLAATEPRLAHVILCGAGPEAEASGLSDGTGWLFGRLALRGYAGTITLAPSSPEALPAWERWLRRGRGWGCGTAAEKAAARARRLHPDPLP